MRCKDCEAKDKKIRDLRISIKCGGQRELKMINEREKLWSKIEDLKKQIQAKP